MGAAETASHYDYDPSAVFVAAVDFADWLIVLPVAIPILFGAILFMVRKSTRLHPPIAGGALLVMVLVEIALLADVIANGPQFMAMGRWLPPFGIVFAVDLLGASFALVAGLVAIGCFVFSLSDTDTTRRRYGFYPFFLLMMAGVTGAFLTGDIFNLYVWFEVLLIASFGLLVLGSEPAQLDGTMKYALLNLVATTIFLIGTGLLYGMFGTLNMADITMKVRENGSAAPLATFGALYLIAFSMKAAAFPLNVWLPASYHVTRMAAAALFAGLLTKVGIYALLRTLLMMFPDQRELYEPVIAAVAIATMAVGVFGAIAQNDVRRLVGFIVVSGIGVMLAGLAMSTPGALGGTIFYAFHSMVVMALLYLIVGMMVERSGGYRLDEAGGLYGDYPFLAALALLAFFSAAGLPPFSGLWPKVILVDEGLRTGAWWLSLAVILTGFFTTIAFGRVFALAFWRPRMVPSAEEAAVRLERQAADTADAPPSEEPSIGMQPADRPRLVHGPKSYAALALLAVLSVVGGVYPEPLIGIANQAAAVLLAPEPYIGTVLNAEPAQ